MTRILPEPNVFGAGLEGEVTEPGRKGWVWDSRLRRSVRDRSIGSAIESPYGDSLALQQMVTMALNPNQLTFQQTKRIARADVRGGAVFYHGVNERGEDNDILILGIQGSTGDIRIPPQRSVGSAEINEDNPSREVQLERAWADKVQARFRAFWSFVQLSREAVLLPDGTYNEIELTCVTPLLRPTSPPDMMFFGFFSQPVTWTESAQQKGAIDWQCEFTVRRFTPDFVDIVLFLSGEGAQAERDAEQAEAEQFLNEARRRSAAIGGDGVGGLDLSNLSGTEVP